MTVLSFFVQLAGATMLLLYAVRMVRTGIERAFGPSFKRVVTARQSALRAASTGVFLAVILQSSAAVTLLVAGFAGARLMSFGTGLPVVLGADLGSALLIQVLSFKLDWLVPLLLAVGGGLFIKSDSRNLRQSGRILLGIAFILISLRFLRETMEPISASGFLPVIADWLERDFIGAFLAGAVLAFVMHSSVAVVLMCVTIVAIGAVPLAAGASLVLGANLGSALIPFYHSRTMPPAARRVTTANLIIRGSGAAFAVILVAKLPAPQMIAGLGDGQALVTLHILFNFVLLCTLPVSRLLQPHLEHWLPDPRNMDGDNPAFRSVLDESVAEKPLLALACLRREVLRMAQIVEMMMAPAMDLYHRFDKGQMTTLKAWDRHVNDALDHIRRFGATVPTENMAKSERRQFRELTEYAIALETAGDVVVRQLLPLAQEKAANKVVLSEQGQGELTVMHERVMANLSLASNVLISDDLENARLLLEEKSEIARQERSSRKKHLKRLSARQLTNFEASDLHLETLRALKEFNSLITTVAYPILIRGGQLLETRLIDIIDDPD